MGDDLSHRMSALYEELSLVFWPQVVHRNHSKRDNPHRHFKSGMHVTSLRSLASSGGGNKVR